MNNSKDKNSNLRALLIGIDYYFPNRMQPDDGSSISYQSLAGCVRDIDHVKSFLITKAKIPEENILKLTSSIGNDTARPSEPSDRWPTYDNICSAFGKITQSAQPGDQVYIHYSGHGGRVKTLIPNKKGEDGLDETLVPTDIGNLKTRYLRDIEMASILKKMVDRKLIVTLVIDSCHSGGITRGRGGAVIRGTNIIDKTPRPQDSLVASIQELENTWGSFMFKESLMDATMSKTISKDSRGLVVSDGGLLPEPKGYVLIAACRPSESAYEYAFEGNERNGALTYWLLKSLAQAYKGLTYKQIHDRIIANIHSQFPLQTPMLEGEGDREIFGSQHIQPIYAVGVMKVDMANERILLNTGQAQGIRNDARFAVYSPACTEFNSIEKRLALVEVQERGAVNSWAKIMTDYGRGVIEKGAQAVLIDPVNIHLKRTVRLVYQGDITIPSTINKTQMESLDQIKNNIMQEGKGFLELALEHKDKANFQVALNKRGEYEIWDPAGIPIPNLNPHVKIDEDKSSSRVIQRLVHLTKYNNIQRLQNLDADSPLSRGLVVEIFEASQDYDLGERPTEMQPLASKGNTKIVNIGKVIVLRIKNTLPKESKQVLNLTVLDLQPDWGVKQIYPSSPGANFIPLDPGHEELFPLQAELPSNYSEGKDIIKVFATIDPTNFRWLELPSLDQPLVQREITRGSSPKNPLEELMAAITKDRAVTRDLNPSATPSKEWTTAQLEIHIMR